MLRREFLSSTAITAMGLGMGADTASPTSTATPSPQTFNILQYGAVPDGKTVNTKQIQAAIDDASKHGGGTVYVPAGTFMTGGLILRSHITLHLASAAKLLGSPSVEDYEFHTGPPTDADANGRHLIFARDCVNVEISGLGTIDGNGSAFWKKRGRIPPAADFLWHDSIASDWQPSTNKRPSPMLEFAYCTNLRIRDITLANSAGWTLRPIACKTVYITGILVRNPVYAPQTDGMDISCCENVFISNCDIDVGDDAICLKSENPYGPLLPTRNIVITNCVLTTSSNGLKMGTATNGSFENIVFTNSVIYNNDVPDNYRTMAGVAIENVDGGSVDGVFVSNIRMQNVRVPIFIRLGHRQTKDTKTFIRNITISGIDAVGAIFTSSITGMTDAFVDTVTLTDIRVRTVEGGQIDWGRPDVPEVAKGYPEFWIFGRLPSYGLYVRHARNVRLRNVEIICDKDEVRPAIVCDDVEDIIVSEFETSSPVALKTVFEMKNCRDIFIQGSRAPKNTGLFLRVVGPLSDDISLVGNDLRGAKTVYLCVDGALEKNVALR
jgi:polygalacturonase